MTISLGQPGRRIAAALFLSSLFISPAAAQEQGDLTRGQAKQIARQALQGGNPQLAGQLALALVRQAPADPEGHILVALAARDVGRLDLAEEAAIRAFELAGEGQGPRADQLRFDAAMLVADLHARREQYTRAQFWLRRADQAATDDRARELVRRAYLATDAKNPFDVQLRFGVKPSNNVNNGADTTIIMIGGLPFEISGSGQKLGGTEATAGVTLSYRIAESERSRTDVFGDLYYRRVWLDSEAAEIAPEAENSDFAYGAVALGVRHRRMIWPELGPSEATVGVGQSWYGGDELARWIELRLGQSVQLEDGERLRFGTVIRSEDRLDDSVNDAESLALTVDYDRRTWSAGLTVKNVWSDSGTVDHFATGVRLARSFGRIGPAETTVSISAENRVYHKFGAAADGRRDKAAALAATFTFPDYSVYGFAPQLSLAARKTWSNVDIYDRNEVSVGLTVVSRF